MTITKSFTSATLALMLSTTLATASDLNFNRIASFKTPDNMAAGEDRNRETSPEIIAATADGMKLVYTDSPLGVLGVIDISNPADPKPLGNIKLGGEPTSVAIAQGNAFVGINTSQSFTSPSGQLKTFDINARSELVSCDLGGQPDSVAVAKDGSFIVIAIENERDEDLNDGVIPQMPAGMVVKFPITNGVADCAGKTVSQLTGLAGVAPTDPEPEFVDVNGLGETVVTLQENNHLAVIGKDGKLLSHFSAGTVDLENIDTKRDGALSFTASLKNVAREPDAVKWLDDNHFVTANEGDYEGGSRGWTIFNKNGAVVYEDKNGFEKAIIEAGHYPEKRSGKKGGEPESIEIGTFGGTPMIFVGSERGSIVGVYDATDPAKPVLKQILASGVAPEGIVAIPQRNLVVTANEKDFVEDGGVRAHVSIYERGDKPASYPSITSAGADELIGWGALSGLAADPEVAGRLYAVNDSFYGMQPTIFEIDATATPARIKRAIRVTRGGYPAQKLDMEGIASDGQGGFWIASEGRTDRVIPHAIYHVNAKGEIKQEIGLPPELMAVEKRFGFEGITVIGDILWMAVQREWKNDPKNHAKLLAYNTKTKEWGAVHYPKAEPAKGWVGLSEITAHGDYVYLLERDNQIGTNAKIKKLYRVKKSELNPGPLGSEIPVVAKEEVHDFLPDLRAPGGYVQDKLEGFAIDKAGNAFAVTDNDGVDDHSGETHFIALGKL
ncbi:MAG: esterase-like activity of phytase family protein [Rhizobiaceae bacterium]